MLSLSVKEVRSIFEETLFKFYSTADWSIASTKVRDKDKEFRIEFRIYDESFWMDIDPAIDSIHIATRSFGEPGHLDSIQMWLSKGSCEYEKAKFDFGWREDLEEVFDALYKALMEKVEKTQKTQAASVYGSSTKVGEPKTSIFNGLKDNEDEYI